MNNLVKNNIRLQLKSYKPNYFEGWFYKFVTADCSRCISIIPGIATGENRGEAISFIQLNQNRRNSLWQSYPLSSFKYSPCYDEFLVGGNSFSNKHIRLEGLIGKTAISGKIHFSRPTPFPQSIYAPSVMGPFSYLSNMQCSYDILSFSHSLTGYLSIDGEIIDFTGGKGYIEKNNGSSFPDSWIWIHGNSFMDNPSASFTFATATLPIGSYSAKGVVCCLHNKGNLINNSTYNLAMVKSVKITGPIINACVSSPYYDFHIKVKQSTTNKLYSPKLGNMDNYVCESLDSVLRLKIYDKVNKKLIFSDYSLCAGSEIGGNLLKLI